MLQNQATKKVEEKWKHFGSDEDTWEIVDQKPALYPSLFAS